jgi:hypothetical protein
VTGADLLSRLGVLDNELDVDTGGADETRALLALDLAQDYYHAVAAVQGGIVNGFKTLVTTSNVASTAWPADLLRINGLDYADGSGEIEWGEDINAHLKNPAPWPLSVGLSAPGRPASAWGIPDVSIFWTPTPASGYSIIASGFVAAADLWDGDITTSRLIVFGHPKIVVGPLCTFAHKLLELGIDDPTDEAQDLADRWFLPVIKAQRRRVRIRPSGRYYTRTHTT